MRDNPGTDLGVLGIYLSAFQLITGAIFTRLLAKLVTIHPIFHGKWSSRNYSKTQYLTLFQIAHTSNPLATTVCETTGTIIKTPQGGRMRLLTERKTP